VDDLIYLDHAATTPVDPRVLEAMWPYFAGHFGNASSVHPHGEAAARALDWARRTVAEVLDASPGEIVFTSGGSESDNLAIKGVAFASRDRGNHLVTTAIEHHAVLHACRYLAEHHGFRVTEIPVDRYGMVDPRVLERALDDETILVSVMAANNEVGTLQHIREIAEVVRGRRIAFHTDAVQAAGALALDVEELGVDLLSLSGHKLYGPKGVGVLYVRRGTPLRPLVHGGSQEAARRAGTENVAGIVGLATALRIAESERSEYVARTARLRDRLIAGVLGAAPGAVLTGHPTRRLPNHASFCFEGVEGEAVLVELGMRGICCSSGSACAAGSSEPSHVLAALGMPPALARTALRLTLGRGTTDEEIEIVLRALPDTVLGLRGAA
jgi:cysteine desulfurase